MAAVAGLRRGGGLRLRTRAALVATVGVPLVPLMLLLLACGRITRSLHKGHHDETAKGLQALSADGGSGAGDCRRRRP